jgi:hypothetical protein
MGKKRKVISSYDIDGTLVKDERAWLTGKLKPLNQSVFKKFQKDKKNPKIKTEITTCRLKSEKEGIEHTFKVKTNTWKSNIPPRSSQQCVDHKVSFFNKRAKSKNVKRIKHIDDRFDLFDSKKMSKKITITDPNSKRKKKGRK